MKKNVIVSLLLGFICTLTGCMTKTARQQSPPVPIPTISVQPTEQHTSELTVHYIDVGQADASLVLCDGHSLLIDGGNAADSDLIAAYLKKKNISTLDYVVCTHAHEDHVGGLSGALSVMNVNNVIAPKTEADTKAYQNFKRKASEQGLTIQHPTAGNSFSLGSSNVQIIGPITEPADDLNNTSIVMKLTYGNTSFLFTGDAERQEERAIIDAGYDLSADVLKVGHHGSDTSTSYVWLREIMPEYAIISVGKGNRYGHPAETVLSRLRDADVKLYRTDLQGDIIAASNGETVTVTAEKNETIQTNETVKADTETAYIGNKNSKKFHRPDCRTLSAEKNRVPLTSYEEAINNGYSPCGNCRP